MSSIAIFVGGLIACATAGAQVGRWLFVRPDKRYPLRPHVIRDTLAIVGGAGFFVAAWVFASLFWLAPHPN